MERLFILCFIGTAFACSSYTCSSSLIPGQCAVFANNTYNLTACSSGYECNLSTMQCEVIPVELSYPGESCKTNANCTNNLCVDKVCSGSAQNETCDSDYSCNPGLYCGNSICQTQLSIGSSGCKSDSQCVNNAFCGANGVCTKYFSKANYESVASCDSSYNNWECASGTCYKFNETTSICAPPLRSFAPPAINCMSDSDCISMADSMYNFRFTTNCTCSYTAKPTSYCYAMPGDAVSRGYATAIQSWVSSKYISKCNTLRRFSIDCIKSVCTDQDLSLELQYFMVWTYYFPYIQNSPSCVRDVLATDYWTTEVAYNNYEVEGDDYDDYNAGAVLGASLVLMGLL